MIDVLHPDDVHWLSRFFSGRNALKWDALTARSAPSIWLEQVLPWINTFAGSGGKSPCVLPVFGPDGPVQWYAMVCDESGAKKLSQEMMAFIGPSFSDFHEEFFTFNMEDEIDKALHERFGRFVFRLVPISPEDPSKIADALQTYQNLLRRRPNVPDRTQRPFGKVRAEFDRALLAGNETDATRLRNELVGSGRVDAEQEKYLDIRMLAGLGRQFQLAHDYPLLKSVLGLSLPAQTIADLVGALYSTYISSIEDSGDDDKVLEVFRSEIANNFGPLFQERKGVRHPQVLKAFLLYELVQVEPNRDRCQAIVSVYPEGSGLSLVKRWADRLSTPTVRHKIDLFESTRQALADEDYDLALQFALEAFPDSWTFGTLLRCAVEMDDSEVAFTVIAKVSAAPDSERLKWTKRDLARIQQLQEKINRENGEPDAKSIRPDSDWLSWVTYVESGLNDRPPLQILEEALPRWSVEGYASNPNSCRELADRIGNAGADAELVFRDAFAYLVEFFVDRPDQTNRAFAPIYSMLIRIVAWNGVVTANELELASTVLQALVSLAPTKSDYIEAVDAFTEIVSANSAPGNLDWALNVSEMLAQQASPDKESRLRLFMAVFDMARSCSHRLRPVQFSILTLLAKDYECAGLLETFPVDEGSSLDLSPRIDFTGLVGIYTLTEQAGQRAGQFLRKMFPQARVELNADHVSTDKLKQLAANADIFVFAWKSSKHQAYFAAKEARGSKRMLLPLGKGSASILDCVLGEIGFAD